MALVETGWPGRVRSTGRVRRGGQEAAPCGSDDVVRPHDVG